MTKRTREFQSIQELMKNVIEENKLKKGLNQVSIADAWKNLMGNGVANYTEKVTLQNNTLIVKLNSSVLREELGHGKEKIIKMLNEEMGQKVIERIMLC
jgi:hypothetical protein